MNRLDVQAWRKGVWFRSEALHESIVKIKSTRGPWGDRVVALWLHRQDSERINVIIYQLKSLDDETVELNWHDGYCFGRVCEDEDDILDGSGQIDEGQMIASIDDSLENMEYGITTKKELTEIWQTYLRNEHDLWEMSPIREERS